MNNNFNNNKNKEPSEIRNQNYFDLIKSVCCPNFKYKSFTFIVSTIDLIIYVITLFFGIKISATELLAPEFETLDSFGMKYPSKIYRFQLHRLILFGLLHANFVHLISNLISQIIIGSILEELIGTNLMSLLYLFSNIGGGLFSSVLNLMPGVGASVAIFGILGGYIGYMMMNWNYLEVHHESYTNWGNIFFVVFVVLCNVSFGINNPLIDNYGHLGGLIYGFFLIWIFIKPIQSNDSVFFEYKIWVKISSSVIIGLTIILILAFWFFVKPK